MTLGNLLSENAGRYSNRTFIRFEGRKLSYSETDRLVSLCAGGLSSIGLQVQGRVAILMENCPEYIISYFGILRAGCITIPINTFLTPEEISYILRDSGAKFLIYSDCFTPHIEKIKGDVQGLTALKFDEIPREEPGTSLVYGSDVAVFLYTSGTTGFPKGAMLTHSNLISNARASAEALQVSYRDRFLLFLPLFHSFAFTACVLVPVCSGASIVLLKSVKPFSNVIKSIIRYRITLFAGVPTIYNILASKRISFMMRFLLRLLLNIRACISGAAALPADTLHTFETRFKVPLIEGYGLTEASPVVAVNPLDRIRKPSSVGLPVQGVEVAVIREDGNKVPAGEVGELIVKGPNVMKGYFNKEEETWTVLRDGWLHTGDMAKIDEDGYIFIVDRKKDMIIVDGMNIYPREVEELILRHDSVEECAMVGLPDGRGSETPLLYVKKKEGADVEENDIRDALKGHIASYKIPRKIIFIDEFPRTATGKIKKTELRKREV
ncbi:MAG: long-chain fatty acid--CoA ligase [Nitrospirota bacterium]